MAGVGTPLMTAWQARERGERGGRRREVGGTWVGMGVGARGRGLLGVAWFGPLLIRALLLPVRAC
jgi:hypothetical protein